MSNFCYLLACSSKQSHNLDYEQQNVVFVEPHGISREGPGSAKVQFHKTIKEIQGRVKEPNLRLESAIVTPTDFSAVKDRAWSRKDWADNHVFFMKELDALFMRGR